MRFKNTDALPLVEQGETPNPLGNTMRDRLIDLLEDTLIEWECYATAITIKEMADHLLANGVIVPPCNVGQTIVYPFRHYWCDGKYEPFEDEVEKITMQKIRHESKFLFECSTGFTFRDIDIGKTVFLTREEAEKALKEREEMK